MYQDQIRTALLAAALAVVASSPADAQSARLEGSLGYSLTRDSELDERFNGWWVSASAGGSNGLSLAAELDRSRHTEPTPAGPVRFSVTTFMFGPRLAGRTGKMVEPYGQFLLGAAVPGIRFAGVSESQKHWAIQPGAGVFVWLRPSLGVRVGADYRRIVSSESSTNQFRLHAGVAVSSR